eukprot:Gb_07366 [translate_table: standard]
MHIFNKIIRKRIVDGGSSVNVIPSSTWEQLGKPLMNPTYYSIKLANQSKIRPIGVLQNVPVMVEGITVSQEFAVVEMTTNTTYATLIGRPWLYDTRAIHDWGDRTFTLRGKGKTLELRKSWITRQTLPQAPQYQPEKPQVHTQRMRIEPFMTH